MNHEPEHHARYRAAWEEYCTCVDERQARLLEREMDNAQNSFTFDEFQVFKQTLPGYVEYWGFMLQKIKEGVGGTKDSKDSKSMVVPREPPKQKGSVSGHGTSKHEDHR